MSKVLISISLAILGLGLASCAVSKNSDGNLLVPSIYYKPTIQLKESQCGSSELRDLLSPQGQVLATLCEKDHAACLMQGSCFINDDGKVKSYNYHSTKNGVPRFVEVDVARCPYGYGVKNSCLDPYFSVAADLSYYQPGDVLFIPRLVGATLPSGEVHHGYVIVRDSGGAIKGPTRFDFFTGFYDHRRRENSLARLGFGDPKNRFEFRRATEEEQKEAQRLRNYPSLNEAVRQAGQL